MPQLFAAEASAASLITIIVAACWPGT